MKRMGVPRPVAHDQHLTVEVREGVFETVLSTVPDSLPEHQGRHEADGDVGARCDWSIELTGRDERVALDLGYHAGSAGLPKAMVRVVEAFESETDDWYQAATPPAPAPDEAADQSAEQGEAARPSASRRRRAIGMLLDLGFFSIPFVWLYFSLASPDSGTPPLLGGLMLFGIIELVLLQIARWSPGYWALGISIPVTGAPWVDPGIKARESWITILVGLFITGYGISEMRDWAFGVPAPAPYFGIPWGLVPYVVITVLFGFVGVLAGLFVLRADVRGIWWGAGLTAASLLALVVGDSELWELWSAYVAQLSAVANGRTPSGEAVEAAATFLRTGLFVVPLLYAVGLGLAWRRLRPDPAAPTP